MAGTDRAWLFVTRFGQYTIAFCYMIAAVTANASKGWWMTVEPAFSLGTISAVLTLIFFLPFFWYVWIRPVRREIAGGSLIYMYICFVFAVSRDLIMCVFWVATFSTMMLPKGKNFAHLFDVPPYAAWVFGAICAALEAIIYAGTTYYLFRLYATAMPNRIPIETI